MPRGKMVEEFWETIAVFTISSHVGCTFKESYCAPGRVVCVFMPLFTSLLHSAQ